MGEPTLTSIGTVLKQTLFPGVIPVIEAEQFITNELTKLGQTEQVGYEFVKKYRTGFSEGTGMFAWNGALPSAGAAAYKSMTGTTKNIAGTIKIYKKLWDYCKGKGEQAYVDLVSEELETLQMALKCEKERMNYGDGGATPLCCVASVTVSSESDTWVTITVDDGGGAALRGDTVYLRDGMPVDILSSVHATVDASMEGVNVLNVTGDTTFTINCASNTAADTLAGNIADGQTIFHADGHDAEFYGLLSWFGSVTNTVFGLDRSLSANSFFRPYRRRIATTGLTEDDAKTGTPKAWSTLTVHQVLNHLVKSRKVDKNSLYGFAGDGVAEYLIRLRQNEGGYHEEKTTIDGWPFSVVMFEDRPILSPSYMLDNTMFWVPMNRMGKFENTTLDFEDMDGNMWKWVDGYHAYTAYCSESFELGCERPDQGAAIFDMKSAYDS